VVWDHAWLGAIPGPPTKFDGTDDREDFLPGSDPLGPVMYDPCMDIVIAWAALAAWNLMVLCFYEPPRRARIIMDAMGGRKDATRALAVLCVVIAPLVTISIIYEWIVPFKDDD